MAVPVNESHYDSFHLSGGTFDPDSAAGQHDVSGDRSIYSAVIRGGRAGGDQSAAASIFSA